MNLTELFNPTFFVYLGILLLVVSIMVYYYESKMREQNHKISSMLSLVSSMAEELNIVRHNMNTMIMNGANNHVSSELDIMTNNTPNFSNHLIPVSDDSSSENDSNKDELSDDEIDEDESDEDESDEDESDDGSDDVTDNENDSNSDNESFQNLKIGDNFDANDVKILNIDLGDNLNELSVDSPDENTDDIELDELDELDDNSDNDNDNENDNNEIRENIIIPHEISMDEDQFNQIKKDENETFDTFNLKTINIDGLDESKNDDNNEEVDYKKLSIGKLRSIVVEKGLIDDASKLNKNKMLKMLGQE